MSYNFTEEQKDKLIKHGGSGFYSQVLQAIELYTQKWQLSELRFNDDYSISPIFFCKSELYGDCVLKMYDDDEIAVEYNALCEYNGGFYIRAFEYGNIENKLGVMLIERAVPGKTLINEPSLEKRLAVFSELFIGRHIEPKKPEIYGYYADWIIDTADDIISKREDDKERYVHALKAKEIYLETASVYDRKLLIHTDLHSGNIISCGDGKYKIIDFNRAVIGDPVFETGMFILYECCWRDKEPEKAEAVLDYLEKSINIPDIILRQCLYITAVIGHWDIDRVKFAESVMNKGRGRKNG